jgi:hypothetical protein
LPWSELERLTAAHRADSRVRQLTTKSQLVALLYGQLAGAASLRDIVTGLHSHAARLYHLGARVPRRSTSADANARRPSAVFSGLLALMMARAHRGLRRSLAETIDSTGLGLDARSLDWARFCEGVCGAKPHVIYDPDADRPIYADHRGARQRHHRRPGDADRTERHLAAPDPNLFNWRSSGTTAKPDSHGLSPATNGIGDYPSYVWSACLTSTKSGSAGPAGSPP